MGAHVSEKRWGGGLACMSQGKKGREAAEEPKEGPGKRKNQRPGLLESKAKKPFKKQP